MVYGTAIGHSRTFSRFRALASGLSLPGHDPASGGAYPDVPVPVHTPKAQIFLTKIDSRRQDESCLNNDRWGEP